MSEKQHIHDIAIWFGSPPSGVDWFRAFEAYGHAMTAASALEQLMALLVVKAEALRLGKRAVARTTPAEHKVLMQNVMRGTFPTIKARLLKAFDLSDALQTGLNDAKEARDNLAHNFWQAHVHNLWDERGIDVIASVCALTANHFRLAANMLIDEAGVDVSDYIEMIRASPKSDEYYAAWETHFGGSDEEKA